ncbi:hypothetical protein AB4Y89_17225 [Terriglobus sp. 2YAB30_2]|uniref:hypothetical protein n=1 Tax=unclassified Terriglobus TaxID=2628988 RepID=UPI003F9B8F56
MKVVELARLRLPVVVSLLSAALFAVSVGAWSARGQIAVKRQGYIPYTDAPIRYLQDELHDPVAELENKLEAGTVKLTYDDRLGYLPSVLKALHIPEDSQTLVFSKTSFQYKKISPEHPRALYFNDDVYVGFVHEGKALEIVSFDPNQGAAFYLLDANKAEHPKFERAELDCTQCHIAPGTRNVPGVLVRSIYPSPTGTLANSTESFVTGQETPIAKRWGGWYVTGSAGSERTMGNSIMPAGYGIANGPRGDPDQSLQPLEQKFLNADYLNPQSDIVAHLVLAHQTQMHNLITLTNYKTRIAFFEHAKKNNGVEGPLTPEERTTFEKPAEELVGYLLFANEAPLPGAVAGNNSFARTFAAAGLRDRKGRSLRDFDLKRRIFRYPVSYLIYSDQFDQLPQEAKTYVYHRLYEVLSGADQTPAFQKISAADRTAAYQILLATKPHLPEEWRQSAAAAARAERLSRRRAG